MHLIWLLFCPAAAYQLLAIAAGLLHLWRRHRDLGQPTPENYPPVTILKPLRGLDPAMHEAFVSQIEQEYPAFEILFGVRDPEDPAIAEVARLQASYPEKAIRLIVGSDAAANRKVGVLLELARHARYPIWVVNDSDIRVTPDYLKRVVAPLESLAVGVVTCLYRPRAHSIAAQWEALGISTDFIPSALVAPLVGVREFGLGSTLAFRAKDLEQAGGFAAFADYIADDYELARRITALGKRALLSTYAVETSLGDVTWAAVWQHQLRWARTIRLSKGLGYLGLPITHAGVWALVAALTGLWPAAAMLLVLRIASALVTGGLVLRSRVAGGLAWLAPAWDLYAFVVWMVCYQNRKVRWRDRQLTLDPGGRIIE